MIDDTDDACAFLSVTALQAVAFASDHSGARYYLCGVKIEVTAGHVTYIATDGHILLAHRENMTTQNTLLGEWIVPADTIKALASKAPTRRSARHDRVEDTAVLTRQGAAFLCQPVGRAGAVFKMIDGTFPDWRRLIPHGKATPSGEAGHYNPELLVKLQKAARILGSSVNAAAPVLVQDPSGPALAAWCDLPDTFGVIMPLRQAGTAPAVPAWARDGGERS